MGANFEKDEEYNIEKKVKLILQINKSCYFPGETITGSITISQKEPLDNPLLVNPEVTFTLMQSDSYKIPHPTGKTVGMHTVEEKKTLLTETKKFEDFENANIRDIILIPFTLKIPNDTTVLPTLNFPKHAARCHYLTVFIPSIEAKKSIILIIKNQNYFKKTLNMCKAPAKETKNINKKKGNFNCSLALPRNTFYYNEEIPFVLKMDCSLLDDTSIKTVEVTIERIEKMNEKVSHHNTVKQTKKVLASKKFKFDDKTQKEVELKDSISIPNTEKPTKTDYVPAIYDALDLIPRDQLYKKFDDYELCPPSYHAMLTIDYILKASMKFTAVLATDEEISVPFDIFPLREEGADDSQGGEGLSTLNQVLKKESMENQ